MVLKVDQNLNNFAAHISTRAHMITNDSTKGNLDICLVALYDYKDPACVRIATNPHVWSHDWEIHLEPGMILKFRDGSLRIVTDIDDGCDILYSEPITHEELTKEQKKAIFVLELNFTAISEAYDTHKDAQWRV